MNRFGPILQKSIAPQPLKFFQFQFRQMINSWHQTIAVGDDNDVEMDGGLDLDGDMDARNQPALPPEKRLNVSQPISI
jgi:hypothetical protein